MKNFIQKGDTITVPAPAGGATSGSGVIVGALFGVAATTAAEGAPVPLATVGVYELPKATSATFTSGGVVSFDIATRKCASPGSGRYPIGIAIEAAGNGSGTVKVRLDGTSTAAA